MFVVKKIFPAKSGHIFKNLGERGVLKIKQLPKEVACTSYEKREVGIYLLSVPRAAEKTGLRAGQYFCLVI